MARNVGDGTGTNAVPEEQGLTSIEGSNPEDPASPYNSNRGGRGPEIQPARDTPLGSGGD